MGRSKSVAKMTKMRPVSKREGIMKPTNTLANIQIDLAQEHRPEPVSKLPKREVANKKMKQSLDRPSNISTSVPVTSLTINDSKPEKSASTPNFPSQSEGQKPKLDES